jgi:hypothetical protein
MTDYPYAPSKDPSSVEPYFFIWADIAGTNVSGDTGELQGATIASYTLTVPTGITKTTDNKNAVTIAGVAYGVSTVVTVWLSSGTSSAEYEVACTIVTSDSPARTLKKTFIVPVRSA